jgi:hypothetical protein
MSDLFFYLVFQDGGYNPNDSELVCAKSKEEAICFIEKIKKEYA